MASELPFNCGRRLLPTLLDHIAEQEPERCFVSVAKSFDPQDGFQDITFGVFANAVNRCAWWIEEQFGRSSANETIAYLGPLDLRYAILVFAAVKTGHQAFFPSPRNSVTAHLDLLEAAKCKAFAVPDPIPAPLQAILDVKSYPTKVIASLETILNRQHVQMYPFEPTFEEAKHDPLVLLHTSGSTGIPKLVAMNHGTYAAMDAQQLIPSHGGKPTVGENWRGLRFFLGFPLFHAATLSCLLGMGIYWDVIWVIGPPVPLTATLVDKIHRYGNVQASALPPSILVDLSKDKEQLNRLCDLKHIIYGGGPLPGPCGHIIAARTTLTTTMGATETAILPMEINDSKDWDYLSYSKELGHEFVKIPEADGLYELIMRREPDYLPFQAVFYTFPDLDTYSTKDTYSKHPNKPDLWKYEGRRDDVIALSNGEKLNPVTMEAVISSHGRVSAAIVGRHGAFQASLLVEPTEYPRSSMEERELIDDLWPTVQKANQDCPAHGRIMKDLILIATKDKPFGLSAKMTIQRKRTLKLYERELDDLYATTTSDAQTSSTFVLHGNWSDLSVTQALLKLVGMVSNNNQIGVEDDFFMRGLDSLQIITLSRYINNWLATYRSDFDLITSKTLYSNPSIAQVETFLEQSRNYERAARNADPQSRMQAIFEKCLVTGKKGSASETASHFIALTGSTGHLGPYLLDLLIRDSNVVQIYCLNRDRDAKRSQLQIHQARGLSTDFGKISFHAIDITRQRLGLTESAYREMSQEMTHFVHAAWDVNTNLTLDSFVPTHLHGCQEIIRLAQSSKKGALILFTSTFESVNRWRIDGRTGPVPEEVLGDWKLPRYSGYAQAKAVAEKVFAQSGVRTKICRLAQLGGPTTKSGMWSKQAWVPSMIASSIYLNQVPESLGPFSSIDWIPVDSAAQILLQIMFAPGAQQAQVYHAASPQRSQWSDIVPALLNMYPEVQAVALKDWVKSVKESALVVDEIKDHNPAAKMIPFFDSLLAQQLAGDEPVCLDVSHGSGESLALRELAPIGPELMHNWLEQWAFKKEASRAA